MQRELIVKSRSLGGTTDLTLLAQLKPGFIDSLESVTYKTRVKRLLDTLHLARRTSHEYANARLLSDSIERVDVIHSVRVAVIEPEGKVLLVVTFDGNWESYIRILWDKVGTLLDLIFCSTVDYVTSYNHSFGEWLEWARRVQVETSFFYGSSGPTARDALYYRRIERMSLRGLGSQLNEMRTVLPSAQGAVEEILPNMDPYPDQPPPPDMSDPQTPWILTRQVVEVYKNGFEGLAALYSLSELFRPNTSDGVTHRLAAISLLAEFVKLCATDRLMHADNAAKVRMERQLSWLFPKNDTGGNPYDVVVNREPTKFDAIDDEVLAQVQGGILKAYSEVTHGVVIFLRFAGPVAAGKFLDFIDQKITKASDDHQGVPGKIFCNVAFTVAGLRAAGIDEDTLNLFPEDFLQGMARRCGTLGDVRNNHPRRWILPKAFTSTGEPNHPSKTIELNNVHAVLQLRCRATFEAATQTVDYWETNHPLKAEIAKLDALKDDRVHILAIQSLRRQYKKQGEQTVIVEHFGYADGNGQPNLEAATQSEEQTHLGEIVWGYKNAADTDSEADAARLLNPYPFRKKWLKNGSFLVMRKYQQNVERFASWVKDAADLMKEQAPGQEPSYYRDLAYAKLMGRYQNGSPLAPQKDPNNLNDFDFLEDPCGIQCPLHAHIRLANPRTSGLGTQSELRADARPPKIMRRSMSYGPAVEKKNTGERGLVFMAYNASLSEQFEVIQRWLVHGNSTGSSSLQSCPIVGVPENHFPRHFRFEHGAKDDAKVLNLPLENQTPMFEQPAVFTQLEWGVYLFTPSMAALDLLQETAKMRATESCSGRFEVPWKAQRGREIIAQLQAIQKQQGDEAAVMGWKTAIEDPESINRLDSAGVWAAIREDHGGILRTPYGVLVASRELLHTVYFDRDRFSVSGQRERMKLSIGDIALGKDGGSQDGPEYWDESRSITLAIKGINCDGVFDLAKKAATKKLRGIVDIAQRVSKTAHNENFDTHLDAREILDEVLADLCEAWFGIQGSPFFKRGGSDLTWEPGATIEERPPLYPGHFTALSRYMFQPNPGRTPVELGQKYGIALTAAMLSFVKSYPDLSKPPKGPDGSDAPIAAALFSHPNSHDHKFVASTLVGIMMGFTPTIIGAVLNVLREWEKDDQLFSLRNQCTPGVQLTYGVAMDLLHRPMGNAALMRPMPQIGWRTARTALRLGDSGVNSVDIQEGDKIVLAGVSGTQQSLEDGQPDGQLMFGGKRHRADTHPTHACPGYDQGIAAMLGTLAALVEFDEEIRPGIASLSFEIRGKSGYVPPVAPPKEPDGHTTTEYAEILRSDLALLRVERVPVGSKGQLLAFGDSWVSLFDLAEPKDLVDVLKDLGYLTPRDFCHPVFGIPPLPEYLLLATMADQKKKAYEKFANFVKKQPQKPSAILLSGGGNDSVGGKLFGTDDRPLLNRKAAGITHIHEDNLKAHLQTLLTQYQQILAPLLQVLADKQWNTPIVVHGYAHPMPLDNTQTSASVHDKFIEAGYVIDGAIDSVVAQDAMKYLIDQLNQNVFQELANNRYPGKIVYVDLRPIARKQEDWFDDLHLTTNKFVEAATQIDKEIQSFWVANP